MQVYYADANEDLLHCQIAFGVIANLRALHLVHSGLKATPTINPVKNALKEFDLVYICSSFEPQVYFVGFKNIAKLPI